MTDTEVENSGKEVETLNNLIQSVRIVENFAQRLLDNGKDKEARAGLRRRMVTLNRLYAQLEALNA